RSIALLVELVTDLSEIFIADCLLAECSNIKDSFFTDLLERQVMLSIELVVLVLRMDKCRYPIVGPTHLVKPLDKIIITVWIAEGIPYHQGNPPVYTVRKAC